MQLLHPLLLLCLFAAGNISAEYLVGIGKSDITGPVADVNLMGYAMPLQIARGIHIRLYARAYVFAEANNHRRRFVYVVSDACMSSQLVTLRVLQRLEAMYGGLYSKANVVLSGTHTHASPAGFLQYVLYSVTSLGFVRQSFDALVDGITEAIAAAHADMRPAAVSYASGELLGANINRSPTAYLANPAAERALYTYFVDKTMNVLRIKQPSGSVGSTGASPSSSSSSSSSTSGGGGGGRGMVTWFPVHCTSMNNTNPFVSGDNKGAAAQFVERAWVQGQATATAAAMTAARRQAPDTSSSLFAQYWGLLKLLLGGKPHGRHQREATAATPVAAAACITTTTSFVAAFAQSSVGDTSPNVQGAFCLDTGEPCEMSRSTCGGRNELCHGRGPAWPDDTASTAVIGRLQADKAQQLWLEPGSSVTGAIDYRHTYINMSAFTVSASKWTRAGVTCPPAMGFSFAAGTTDGPGAFDFTQGDTNGTAFWRLVRDFLSAPSPEQQACHAPKPILLNTGYINQPYAWQPHVTEVSVMRLGNFVIVAVPGEFSTMAGRRIRAAVAETIGAAWGPNLKVVLSGLSGTYSSYITTFEEYQVQRYEGASTLYGPHTLDAYIQTAVQLVQAMLSGQPVSSAVLPPDLMARQVELLPPVVMDAVPAGAAFGDVVVEPLPKYKPGDTVEAVFRSGCPRNNLRRGGTFLEVQVQQAGGGWATVATDADWETHFHWERHWKLDTHSFATVRWSIPNNIADGVYRVAHFGDAKPLFGSPSPFTGFSRSFKVSASPEYHKLLTGMSGEKAGVGTRQGGTMPSCHPLDPTSLLVHGQAAPDAQDMLQGNEQKENSRQLFRQKTLDERWRGLSSLYGVATQWQVRFGPQCQRQYKAWWRSE